MLGRSNGNHDWLLAFLAVFVYVTHATQAIAFEWKPGFSESIIRYTIITTVYCFIYTQTKTQKSSTVIPNKQDGE